MASPVPVRWLGIQTAGTLDPHRLSGVRAVVHLAGAGLGDHRWSARYKEIIVSSRVDGTATLARALAAMSEPPSVLLSGSAVGYYGVRGDEDLTEEAGAGGGFLADLCAEWECGHRAGCRSRRPRRPSPHRCGDECRGRGAQEAAPPSSGWDWAPGSVTGASNSVGCTRRDVVAALTFLLGHDDVSAPVNVTAPAPVANTEFTRALGRALRRPAFLVAPTAVLRAAAGEEMTAEFLLASQRALPDRLHGSRVRFRRSARLRAASSTALGDRARSPLDQSRSICSCAGWLIR